MDKPIIPGFEQPDSIPLDEHGNIVADVKCLVCGYNLRTQSIQGRCPECGTAVGRSAHGDLLRYCEPAWVETLSSGMNWILAGIIANFVLKLLAKGVAAVSTTLGQPPISFEDAAAFVASLVSLVGYWKLTTPNPEQPDQAGSANVRSFARWSEVVSALLLLGAALLNLPEDANSLSYLGVGIVSGLVALVALTATFTYKRQLALRIPDEKLASQTQVVMWGMLVCMGVMMIMMVMALGTVAGQGNLRNPSKAILPMGCIGLVGLVVFGIWSLVLVVRYRRAFEKAAQDARSTWAASAVAE